MLQRAIIAFIIGPALLVATYFGGWFYFAPLLLLLLAAGVEYANIMRTLKHNTPLWLLLPAITALLAAAWWPHVWGPQWDLHGLALFISLFAALIYALWLFERGDTLDAALDWFALVGGIMLLGWVGSHFFLLRNLPEDGWRWTFVALLGIWTADIAAFLVGKYVAGRWLLGRHMLVPRLSPKKTVEGYVAGVIAGPLFAALTALALDLPIALAALAGLAVGVLGLFGDLSISLLKREAGVKDSGRLFPGHGGALDRLDSLIWAVAIVYYLVVYLGPLFT